MATNSAPSQTGGEPLGSGKFFGKVGCKVLHPGAIFSELCHAIPRRLPSDSHELSFFELILGGQYGERYGPHNKQFSPFSLLFRPAGIPHQDEIGPLGVKIFHIELRPCWEARIADCSGDLWCHCLRRTLRR